jgi:hypothetical protein
MAQHARQHFARPRRRVVHENDNQPA